METQAARNRLEAVINVSAIALAKLVALRDKEGAIVDFIYEWLNDAAVQIGFGATGKSMLQSFPYTSAGGLFKLMVKAVETGQMQQTEFHYVSGNMICGCIIKLPGSMMALCFPATMSPNVSRRSRPYRSRLI